MEQSKIQAYIQVLKEELIPAMGCTEPIALGYAGALARKVLGKIPQSIKVEASGNIIKNVKSVIVPNTGNKKGIEAAVIAGVIAGDATKELEVIASIQEESIKAIDHALKTIPVSVSQCISDEVLDIYVHLYYKEECVTVRICKKHTHVESIIKNGEVLQTSKVLEEVTKKSDRTFMCVEEIYQFISEVDLSLVESMITRQIELNSAISKEGLEHDYGANIGSVLLATYGNDPITRAKAMAASGSDARMAGCDLPVVINSGSGNQGMTVSLPVIEYASSLQVTKEELYRALLLSNLLAIHLKTGIGTLSAYCGAASAGVSAGCGIAYLHKEDYKCITHTLVNGLAIISGMVCDGAKPSCAGKIAASVDAGILGYKMYHKGQQFKDGEGLVKKGVENTIKNIGRLSSQGMKETDEQIIAMMLD